MQRIIESVDLNRPGASFTFKPKYKGNQEVPIPGGFTSL